MDDRAMRGMPSRSRKTKRDLARSRDALERL